MARKPYRLRVFVPSAGESYRVGEYATADAGRAAADTWLSKPGHHYDVLTLTTEGAEFYEELGRYGGQGGALRTRRTLAHPNRAHSHRQGGRLVRCSRRG